MATTLFGNTNTGTTRSYAFEELEGAITQDAMDGYEITDTENELGGIMPQMEALNNTASLMNFALAQESHDAGSYRILVNALAQHHKTLGMGMEEFQTTYAVESNDLVVGAAGTAGPSTWRGDHVGNTDGPGWMDKVKGLGTSASAMIKNGLKKLMAFVGSLVGKAVAWFKSKSSIMSAVNKVQTAYNTVKAKVTPSQGSKLHVIGNYLKAAGKLAAIWPKVGAIGIKLKTSKFYKDGAVISDAELDKMVAEVAKANPEKAAEAGKILREKHSAIATLAHKYVSFMAAAQKLGSHITSRSLATANLGEFDDATNKEKFKHLEANSAGTEKAANAFERAWAVLSAAFEKGMAGANSDKDTKAEDTEAVQHATKALEEVLEENHNVVLGTM